jgi:hypothetical protein
LRDQYDGVEKPYYNVWGQMKNLNEIVFLMV